MKKYIIILYCFLLTIVSVGCSSGINVKVNDSEVKVDVGNIKVDVDVK